MKDNVKRLLAFVLAAVMLVSLCPTLGVSAATAEPEAEAAAMSFASLSNS